jgi:hypothetical protein
MVRAIEKPRAELWPMPPARYALTFATAFPGLVDRVMAKYRGEFEKKDTGSA